MIINTIHDLCPPSISWYLQLQLITNRWLSNSIDEEREPNRTEPNPTFTELEPNTNPIFKSTQNPNRTEPLSSKNPIRIRTQNFWVSSIFTSHQRQYRCDFMKMESSGSIGIVLYRLHSVAQTDASQLSAAASFYSSLESLGYNRLIFVAYATSNNESKKIKERQRASEIQLQNRSERS